MTRRIESAAPRLPFQRIALSTKSNGSNDKTIHGPMRMRTIIALAGASLLTVAGAGAQDEDGPGKPNRFFGDGEMPEFIKMFDVDENGRLSAEEAQALRDVVKEKRDEFLAGVDRNGDGRLSMTERLAALAEIRQRILERRIERFEEADSDGNQAISLEEFLALPHISRIEAERAAAIFDHLDADGDDGISAEEFFRRLPPIGPPPRGADSEGEGEGEGDGEAGGE